MLDQNCAKLWGKSIKITWHLSEFIKISKSPLWDLSVGSELGIVNEVMSVFRIPFDWIAVSEEDVEEDDEVATGAIIFVDVTSIIGGGETLLPLWESTVECGLTILSEFEETDDESMLMVLLLFVGDNCCNWFKGL